jgi:hypothetical protein
VGCTDFDGDSVAEFRSFARAEKEPSAGIEMAKIAGQKMDERRM